MLVSRETQCFAFIRAFEQARHEVETRRARIANALSTRAPNPTPEDPYGDVRREQDSIRAKRFAIKAVRDGVAATARLDTRCKPIHSTEYEGDVRVNGSLHVLKCKALDDGRHINRARAAVASMTAEADLIHLYRRTLEILWSMPLSRDAKRSLRGRAKLAVKDVRRGDYRAALDTIRG